MKSVLTLLLCSLLFVSCVSAPKPQPAQVAAPQKQLIYDTDFPDPAVILAPDGYYYAYATQTVDEKGAYTNIQIARSKDLAAWEKVGDALPKKPRWASKTQKLWAPHVSHHEGTYYMYYSADPNTLTGLCLAVATAKSPGGPFVDIGKPLHCGKSFINIDPMQFDDPKTGKALLYWGSGFQAIRVQELDKSRVRFAKGSRPVDLILPNPDKTPENYQRLIEGAWITEIGGQYYLFFSGDNCCDPNPHYAVMVARSQSATGPFELFTGGLGLNRNVVVAEDELWSAPGHNSVIQDKSGNHWLLYHGIDRKNPHLKQSIPGDRITRRVMLRSRMEVREGWPTLKPLVDND